MVTDKPFRADVKPLTIASAPSSLGDLRQSVCLILHPPPPCAPQALHSLLGPSCPPLPTPARVGGCRFPLSWPSFLLTCAGRCPGCEGLSFDRVSLQSDALPGSGRGPLLSHTEKDKTWAWRRDTVSKNVACGQSWVVCVRAPTRALAKPGLCLRGFCAKLPHS